MKHLSNVKKYFVGYSTKSDFSFINKGKYEGPFNSVSSAIKIGKSNNIFKTYQSCGNIVSYERLSDDAVIQLQMAEKRV